MNGEGKHLAEGTTQTLLRRQTRFMRQLNTQANSGAPSTRNRRRTDGLPI